MTGDGTIIGSQRDRSLHDAIMPPPERLRRNALQKFLQIVERRFFQAISDSLGDLCTVGGLAVADPVPANQRTDHVTVNDNPVASLFFINKLAMLGDTGTI